MGWGTKMNQPLSHKRETEIWEEWHKQFETVEFKQHELQCQSIKDEAMRQLRFETHWDVVCDYEVDRCDYDGFCENCHAVMVSLSSDYDYYYEVCQECRRVVRIWTG